MSYSPGDLSKPTKDKPISAGILLYRKSQDGLNVLLAHPGGPFFVRKEDGAWTIPKGLIDPGETPQMAALREFDEELGWRPEGDLKELGDVRLKSRKRVIAFAVETDLNPSAVIEKFSPGVFAMEWPRGSGRKSEFPEVDRIEFFPMDVAAIKINPAQAPLLDRLLARYA